MDKTAPETCEQCPTRGTHRCLVRDLDATTGKYVRRPGPRCPFVRLDAARAEVERLDQAVATALVLAQEKEADLARITRDHDHLVGVVNGMADQLDAAKREVELWRSVADGATGLAADKLIKISLLQNPTAVLTMILRGTIAKPDGMLFYEEWQPKDAEVERLQAEFDEIELKAIAALGATHQPNTATRDALGQVRDIARQALGGGS